MRKTILCVDDTAHFRRVTRMTLEYMGFRVLEAASGAEGLEVCKAHAPDLVLLDVHMPGGSGLHLCEALRCDTLLATIPVVFLTSASQPADIQAGLSAGAVAYMTKPFQPVEMIEIVTQILEKNDSVFANRAGILF